MSVTNSSNMLLPIPGVGTESGPDYAFDINSCLTLIDLHDHSPGKGVQITPSGLNINTDLTFRGSSATTLLNVSFTEQSVATSVIQALSVAPGSAENDLWYTDSNGIKVQITDNGQLAAVATTVSGLSYSAGIFSFRQTPDSLPTTPADLDAGSITVRPNVAGTTNRVTISPNASQSGATSFILPLLPASQSLMTINASGSIVAPAVYPLPQAALAANSVGTAQLQTSSVITAKIADAQVTPGKLSLVLQANTGAGAIPNTTSAWYALGGNSVTLSAGTWRLTGSVNWISVGGVVDNLEFGYFGANGNNTTATPAALVPGGGTLSGRLGIIKAITTNNGTDQANFFSCAPETIIVTTGTTTVYLNMFHNGNGGPQMQYLVTIAAQQIG